MELSEQPVEVLQQFAAGEIDAFETLFRQFQGEVYSWIIRIVRDPSAAEDLTVDAFWRIYRAHARFDPSRSFGAWARKVATNVAIDFLKTARAPGVSLDENLLAESAPDLRAGNPAILREVRERTQHAFQQLPAKLRVVATLALIEEVPQSEIAEALNISTPAVKSRLFRAVQLLRRKLGSLDINHE
jgi:RNA polymerase sigma-70 factor (ECF subfamily)